MIAILGMGEQGKAIVNYLLKKTDEFIVTVDINKYAVDSKYTSRWVHLQTNGTVKHTFDLLSDSRKKETMTVINCLPTEYILDATKEAISRSWNIVDLAGVTEVERQQMKLADVARKRGSVVVRACGIAPGIVSSFVADFARQFKKDLFGIKVFCGGIPKYPTYPLGYIRVFYESGVIKEYSGVAHEIKGGRKVNVPTLSDLEHVSIPSLGILEADVTSGGISTTADNLDVEYFSYKTLRYPGHFQYIKNNVLNQPNPENVLSEIISPVSADNPDIIVLHFEVETTEGTEFFTYFWEYDTEADLSAMSQATGYIAAEVALQTASKKPGVYDMGSFNPYVIRKKVREIREEGNFSENPIKF